MARKNDENPAPVVTSLPLPSSDSVLVIDLPDGQKLLVGKMNHGTVIEVATWRGTGRPDSRTNRLMLGMSSSETESQINSQSPEEELVVDKRSVKYWIWLGIQLSKKVKEFIISIALKLANLISKKTSKDTSAKQVESIEDDVQAWLDNIKTGKTSKSLTALSGAAKSKSTSNSAASAPKGTKKSSSKVKSRSKA